MADDPEIQAFFDDGGEFTKHSDGYQQKDAAQPNYSLEDGWRWDDDDTFAGEHEDAIYAMQDSQALPNQFPIVYFDDYFEGDNYEEPDVNDFEWSGPIQPNAPPNPYVGDLVEFPFDEGYETHTQTLDYQQQDAPNFSANTPEDPWDWDSEFATDDDYPGLTSDDPVGPNPVAGTAIFLEDPPDTNEDDVDDDVIDHFTNYDSPQPSFDDAWDWDEGVDDELVTDETQNLNAPLAGIPYDDPWDYDQEAYDEEPPPDPPVVAQGPVFTYQDEWDWDLELYEDPTEADFPQDVLGANAPAVITVTYQDEWGFDEEDVSSSAGVDSYLQSDATTGTGFPLPSVEWDYDGDNPPPDVSVDSYIQADNPNVSTTVLAFTDDVATQDDEPEDFFADHFGNVNLDQPSYDDAWDWDQENYHDDETWQAIGETEGANVPVLTGVIYDDAWDWSEDAAEEFQQDDQFANVNVPVFTALQPQDEDFTPWDDDGTDDVETDATQLPPPTGELPVSGFIITIPYRTLTIATPVRTFGITIPYRVFTVNGATPGTPAPPPPQSATADSTSITADTTNTTADE